MKLVSILITAAAFGLAAPTFAQSCDEMGKQATAMAQAKTDKITAAVMQEMEKVSARAEERWNAMEAKIAAGEVDQGQAERMFAELEAQAKAETAAVQEWGANEHAKITEQTQAEMTKGMANCSR